MSKLVFQVAVPKSFTMRMEPASGHTLPARRQAFFFSFFFLYKKNNVYIAALCCVSSRLWQEGPCPVRHPGVCKEKVYFWDEIRVRVQSSRLVLGATLLFFWHVPGPL
ncbi:unnamed protein product, partial [Discosporangium mesarthrocarpum]